MIPFRKIFIICSGIFRKGDSLSLEIESHGIQNFLFGGHRKRHGRFQTAAFDLQFLFPGDRHVDFVRIRGEISSLHRLFDSSVAAVNYFQIAHIKRFPAQIGCFHFYSLETRIVDVGFFTFCNYYTTGLLIPKFGNDIAVFGIPCIVADGKKERRFHVYRRFNLRKTVAKIKNTTRSLQTCKIKMTEIQACQTDALIKHAPHIGYLCGIRRTEIQVY